MAINFPIPKNLTDIKNMDIVYKFSWILIICFIVFIIYKLNSKITQFSGFSGTDIKAFQNKYKTRIDKTKMIINPTQQQKEIAAILKEITAEEVINISSLIDDLKKLPGGSSSKPIMALYDDLQASTHDIIKNQIYPMIENNQKRPVLSTITSLNIPPPPPPPPKLPPPPPPRANGCTIM